MKRAACPFLLLLVMTLSGCAGVQYTDTVQARDLTQSREPEIATRVLAQAEDWRNSGVAVRKGSTYKITAKGRWTAGALVCGWTGPDGVGASPFCFGPYVKGSGSLLVGKIGEDGEPFAVGDELDLAAGRDGVLFFRINDGIVGDNDGFVQVKGSFPAATGITITFSYPAEAARVSIESVAVSGLVMASRPVSRLDLIVNGRPVPVSRDVWAQPSDSQDVGGCQDHQDDSGPSRPPRKDADGPLKRQEVIRARWPSPRSRGW